MDIKKVKKQQQKIIKKLIFNDTSSFNWFWNTKAFQLRFNGVYSRDNLPKVKNGTYVINIDEYFDIGTLWIFSVCTK